MIDTAALVKTVETGFPGKLPVLNAFLSSVSAEADAVAIRDRSRLAENIGVLAYIAAFGSAEARLQAHQLVWGVAGACGIYCASIDGLYRAVASGAAGGFTVPAMNIRAIAFESARGVFKAIQAHNVGAAIFELSRGEIGFTGQRPHEYATVVLCAAIAEGFSGPLFLQGDHFQISATRFAEDPEKECTAVKSLIAEAISAGFYNIDIDSSTLVDLSCAAVEEQQRPNFEQSAELALFTRAIEPPGISVSLGGEIGEVGEHNSTAEELNAYLAGYNSEIENRFDGDSCAGLTKISVQTGTRHGGNILADGSIGEMNVDFDLIRELSRRCRDPYGLAGCVQHGASMLSLEKISQLPGADCVEVHLAAAFLNVVYEQLPEFVVSEADNWLKAEYSDEWKSGWSEPQFIHHARRYPIGPNKRLWWDSDPTHENLRGAIEKKAAQYFVALNVVNTREQVAQLVPPVSIPWSPVQAGLSGSADESDIKDLAS
ncbi:hypothetical protein AB833_12915 [Chromatiales bacterium (ex Bugula neritina AB1)]|nr:hypothetical protein AB833_12915 [Chromatiales bacterium (ex Bugula neritina AB1)]